MGDANMVFRDNTISKDDAREIVLYTTNHPDIHRQMTSMVLKALGRRKINGTYNHTMATKAFSNIIVEGIKRYSKDFGKVSLNPITREYAAKMMQSELQSDLDYIVKEMRIKKKSGKPWSGIGGK
jgi:hypothetical protein